MGSLVVFSAIHHRNTGGSTRNYMEAISAIERTTVSIVTHTPRKTQTLPAGPPLAREEALVL